MSLIFKGIFYIFLPIIIIAGCFAFGVKFLWIAAILCVVAGFFKN